MTNSLNAKLYYPNFHPLEVVSRYRDPQLQVGENYSCLISDQTLAKILILKRLSYFTLFINNGDWATSILTRLKTTNVFLSG